MLSLALNLLFIVPLTSPKCAYKKEFKMKKKSKLDKFTPLVIGTAMLTLVAACGSDDDDNGSSQVPQQEQSQEGTYRVVLSPVNADVAGSAKGTGEFSIAGDEFRASMNVSDALAATHAQHIHIGTSCPSGASDTNQDSFIDVVEASTSAGGVLVPLDADLRSQDAGATYPAGANYNYVESASLLAMEVDLRLPDTDTSDIFVKLGLDDPFTLEGRVVIVHGVPASTSLPPSVQGAGDLSPQQALPILCGVITRVQEEETGTTSTTGTTGTTTGITTGTPGTSGI